MYVAALGRTGTNVSPTVAEHNPLDTEERGGSGRRLASPMGGS